MVCPFAFFNICNYQESGSSCVTGKIRPHFALNIFINNEVVMKLPRTVAAILFFFLICPDINAGTVYRWTDENGVIHITNLPALKPVKGRKIIRYQEKTSEEKLKYQNLQKKQLEKRLKQQKIQEAQKARIRAEKVKKEAEEAKIRAEQARQLVQEHTETYAPRKKKKRNKYRKKGRRLIEEAKKAEALADEAVINANQAEKEAVETAQEAQAIEGQKR